MPATSSIKRITVAARITEREYAALKRLADEREETVTQVIRDWIKTLPTYVKPGEERPRRQAR
jgi:hypothetical protein